jgi:hypothetical protein
MQILLIKTRYFTLGAFVISSVSLLTGELFGAIFGYVIALGIVKLFDSVLA